MVDLHHKFEEEKRKLNELGQKSLERGIPLFQNEAVQAQSRKVDDLINRLHQKKGERKRQSP
ncbi:aspartyl-phosphate phosphatase Spo0E family protein [Cohnella nanjingensis]|uniref:Aspartyl-phosphate phosphatase Spo0E family protein n=1 Tax=Cohnella nanjingensis TaxID=1387779 RepID=A0A7X0RUD5_9BACL|nr:aspartyl-phosphate phosphatase Spo0E family protein [Cohnella nanjingensis]